MRVIFKFLLMVSLAIGSALGADTPQELVSKSLELSKTFDELNKDEFKTYKLFKIKFDELLSEIDKNTQEGKSASIADFKVARKYAQIKFEQYKTHVDTYNTNLTQLVANIEALKSSNASLNDKLSKAQADIKEMQEVVAFLLHYNQRVEKVLDYAKDIYKYAKRKKGDKNADADEEKLIAKIEFKYNKTLRKLKIQQKKIIKAIARDKATVSALEANIKEGFKEANLLVAQQ